MSASSFSTRLATPAFLRLWIVGGLSISMLWLEVLAAALFTFDATGSGWAVALVSSARAAPLLAFGAVAGVAADAWDRRRIVLAGALLTAVTAAAVCLLASAGLVRPWHLGLAAFVSGSVYATELPARRRMVAESTGPAGTEAAIATDSLTSYAARCIGPLIGGLAYRDLGLAGAFAISAFCNLAAAGLMIGFEHRQRLRTLALAPIGRDLREAMAFVRGSPALLTLLAVTVAMNLCGYSYATLMTPVARESFGLDAAGTGLLAAAEPAGALIGGLILTRITLRGLRLHHLMGGVALLTGALVAAALAGAAGVPLALVLAILACGGVGSAVYNNTQTALVMVAAPPAIRSRVMGLVTVCIGSWPLGMLFAGGLVGIMPPLGALAVLAGTGFALIAGIAVLRRQRATAAA